MLSACACGCSQPHEIARRVTADGSAVVLWDDGTVTGRMGYKLPGVPMPKTPSKAVGWLLMGEVCLYDLAEVPALYAACRWVAARGGLPGDVRARFARVARPKLTPLWTVYRTDRDGRPTERFWRLPRLRWPGLVVWDHVNLGSRRGGRYELWAIDRAGVCATTGFAFANLGDLTDHLLRVQEGV